MVRYADDFVVLCKDAKSAEKALAVVKAWTENNGLTLHPDKIHAQELQKEGPRI